MNQSQSADISKALKIGRTYENSDEPTKAIDVYTQILNQDRSCEEAIKRISECFVRYENYANAIESFKYYLTISEQKYAIYINLGFCFERIKSFETAINYYKEAIEINPKIGIAYAHLSELMARLNRSEEIESLINEYANKYTRIGELNWIMAKFCLRNKEYKKAEKLFKKANNLGVDQDFRYYFLGDFVKCKIAMGNYNDAMRLNAQAQLYESQKPIAKKISSKKYYQIIEDFAYPELHSDVKKWQSSEVDTYQDPIFIVGFPRSGTTLLEQMLFSHPNLVVSEEASVLPDLVSELSTIVDKPITLPESLDQLTDKDIKKIRKAYFTNMAEKIPAANPKLRIVDKLPISIIYLPFIKRFFPKSPVLVMIRDPRDVCTSCFLQTFNPNPLTINFYTLESTFKFYAKIMSAYIYLKNNVDLNILEIKYEEMCQNIDPFAHQIIEHIGEKWDDNVLSYYTTKHNRYVATPSFSGVNQAINQNAINNWKNYERSIKPHQENIVRFLNEWKYEI